MIPFLRKRIMSGFVIFLALVMNFACEKEAEPVPESGTEISPAIASMVSAIERNYHPLAADPLQWQDEDLAFLDSIAGSRVLAMGEASHGTGEFFDAKFRAFRYLVEHHGYRVFVIEADYGECMMINEAIQEQRTLESIHVAKLMKETMLFWTWRTREVRDMLLWMNAFNQGREEADRIRYVGMDCQVNDNSAQLLQQYLGESGFPCMSLADTLLNRLVRESTIEGDDYTNIGFQFARGTFNAYGIIDGQVSYMQEQSVAVVPDDSSMTWIMSLSEEDYYHVKMHDLLEDQAWIDAFDRGLVYLNMGAVYDRILWHCYQDIYMRTAGITCFFWRKPSTVVYYS